jgi:hypothetical protein
MGLAYETCNPGAELPPSLAHELDNDPVGIMIAQLQEASSTHEQATRAEATLEAFNDSRARPYNAPVITLQQLSDYRHRALEYWARLEHQEDPQPIEDLAEVTNVIAGDWDQCAISVRRRMDRPNCFLFEPRSETPEFGSWVPDQPRLEDSIAEYRRQRRLYPTGLTHVVMNEILNHNAALTRHNIPTLDHESILNDMIDHEILTGRRRTRRAHWQGHTAGGTLWNIHHQSFRGWSAWISDLLERRYWDPEIRCPRRERWDRQIDETAEAALAAWRSGHMSTASHQELATALAQRYSDVDHTLIASDIHITHLWRAERTMVPLYDRDSAPPIDEVIRQVADNLNNDDWEAAAVEARFRIEMLAESTRTLRRHERGGNDEDDDNDDNHGGNDDIEADDGLDDDGNHEHDRGNDSRDEDDAHDGNRRGPTLGATDSHRNRSFRDQECAVCNNGRPDCPTSLDCGHAAHVECKVRLHSELEAGRTVTKCTACYPTCTICQAQRSPDQPTATLGCGHEYHHTCAQQMLLRSATACPVCRAEVTEVNGEQYPPGPRRQPSVTPLSPPAPPESEPGLPPLRVTRLPTPREIAQHPPLLSYVPGGSHSLWRDHIRTLLLRFERAVRMGSQDHITDTFVALMEAPSKALRRGGRAEATAAARGKSIAA